MCRSASIYFYCLYICMASPGKWVEKWVFNCNKEKSFGSNKRHGVEHLLSINKKTVKTSTLLDINYHHVFHHPLISMPSKQVTTLSVSGSSSLFLFWPIKERPTKSSRDLGLPSLLGLYISAGTRTRQSKSLPSESMKVTVKSLSCFSWQKRPDFPINRLRLKSSTSVSRSWKRLLPPPNGKIRKVMILLMVQKSCTTWYIWNPNKHGIFSKHPPHAPNSELAS